MATKTAPLFPHLKAQREANEKARRAKGAKGGQTFVATPKQVELIDLILKGIYNFIGFGGGIRGTKTFGVLAAIILLCRIFPRSRWAIVRKDLPTIKRNLLPSFNKIRNLSGGFVGEVNKSDWTATCSNGSQIIFFAELYEQDPDLERWKGLEVNGFVLEEASELNEKSGHKAIERAGSWIIPPTEDDPEPQQPHPLVLITFNPTRAWVRKWFYEPWKSGTLKAPYAFLPTTIADNPYVTEQYRESLKYLPPEEYKRFVLGEWDFVDDPDQLILSEWVWKAKDIEPNLKRGMPPRLGVDVARYGDDYTTLARLQGNALVGLREFRHLSLDRVAELVKQEAAGISAEQNASDGQRITRPPIDASNIAIDTVGLGAGVVDICRKDGLNVREFNSGGAPVIRDYPKPKEADDRLAMWHVLMQSVFRFKNLRAQAYWEFREKLRLGLVSLSLRDEKGHELPIPEKLVADLASVRYQISGDKVISVESKDSIKLRLGRSTDDSDAVVMAAFDLPPDHKARLGAKSGWFVVKQ